VGLDGGRAKYSGPVAADRTAGPPRALDRPPPTDVALIVLAVSGVSTSAPLIRYAAAPAMAIAMWRNALGALVLVPIAGVRRRAELRALTGVEWRLCTLAGLLLAAHFATWVPSLDYTTIASSVALVAVQPVWAALIARGRGDHVPRAGWAGIWLAVVGAALLSGVDWGIGLRFLWGDVLALVGGALAAAYVTVGAQVRQTVSTTAYTAVCYTVAAAALLVVCAVGRQSLVGYDAGTWWAIVALTIGAQLLGHSVFNRVLKTTSATVVSISILFEIVGAAVLGGIFFDEWPSLAALPAAALIAAGVVVVVRSGSRPEVAGVPVSE
jgi:drug/metabolite transporter (DMT)-like permease